MTSWLQYLFFSVPFALALGAAIVIVLIAGSSIRRSWLLGLPFLIALFWLTENRYGRIDAVGPSLLSRGSGVLLFAAFLWAMLLTAIWARVTLWIESGGRKPQLPSVPLGPWFLAWAVLLGAHVVAGLLTGVELRDALAPTGFSFVVWAGVVVALMACAFRTPGHAEILAWGIVLTAGARAAFGLVRWALFGGDPANAYANRHGLDVKLTFFDVNDSLLCILAVVVALIWLYRAERPARGALRRGVLMAVVLLCLASIVLSFRRTVWLGAVLGLGFALLQLPPRVRWRIALVAFPFLVAAIAYAANKRLSQAGAGFLTDLVPKSFGPEGLRVLELRLAFESFMESPVVGLGSWGAYRGWQAISWQHQIGDGGGGRFLHSGLLHLALKTGLVGLLLLGGTLWTFWRAWRRMRVGADAHQWPLAVAGVAGLLFMLPDFLVGTPIPQVRTMMMIGLCLALPFVAQRCASPAARVLGLGRLPFFQLNSSGQVVRAGT